MQVVVTGGTGLLGGALTRALLAAGDTVTVLTHSAAARIPEGAQATPWPAGEAPDDEPGQSDPGAERDWRMAFEGCDAVVHLAGAPLANRRWDAAQKRLIAESRIGATKRLIAALRNTERRPSVLVSGSAVGYYGDCGDALVGEDAACGGDFLARVCKVWEAEALPAESLGIRTILLRTSLVLDHDAGGLPRIVAPFRIGAGGPLGSGRQWVPWIHRDDAVELIRFAIGCDACRGPINCTSPHPVTNRDFSQTVGGVLGRPSWAGVPALALRLAWGEMADTVLLAGQRALPQRVLALGFGFRFPHLEAALRDILA